MSDSPSPADQAHNSAADHPLTSGQRAILQEMSRGSDEMCEDWTLAVYFATERIDWLEAEVERLKAMVESLSRRVVAQSELLSRRAERGASL